jgi:fructose-bisphosphate aldolase class 1
MMIRCGQHLWELSFAFRRALLSPELLAWASDNANADAVWKQLANRARVKGLARSGRWTKGA